MRGHIIFLFSLIAVKSLFWSQQVAIFNNPTIRRMFRSSIFEGPLIPEILLHSFVFAELEGILILHTLGHFLIVNHGHICYYL